MSIDVEQTMQVLYQLMVDEVQHFFEARTPRWFFEMHPEALHEIRCEFAKRSYGGPAGVGEFNFNGIPVRPNPTLARDDVRLLVGERAGKVARTEGVFTDERRRR